MRTSITRLALQQFRCFSEFTIEPKSGINLISGANGLGKTTILEALYFLSYGRSFRTAQLDRVIRQDQDGFTLFCEFSHGEKKQKLGVSRHKKQPATVRLNGEAVTRHAVVAKQLPVLVMNPESFRFFTDGSKSRRQVLDWGVFFAEPAFMQAWQQASRIIQQRNQALKMQQPYQVIAPWDQQLIQAAEVIDQAREAYVVLWIDVLRQLLGDFWGCHDLSMSYARGWPQGESLQTLLEKHYQQDRAQGFTQYGPHRADIRLRAKGMVAQDRLSRGQQKRLIYALKLAQGKLYMDQKKQTVIYLLDDIQSELDSENCNQLLASIMAQDAQTFLTSVQNSVLCSGQNTIALF